MRLQPNMGQHQQALWFYLLYSNYSRIVRLSSINFPSSKMLWHPNSFGHLESIFRSVCNVRIEQTCTPISVAHWFNVNQFRILWIWFDKLLKHFKNSTIVCATHHSVRSSTDIFVQFKTFAHATLLLASHQLCVVLYFAISDSKLIHCEIYWANKCRTHWTHRMHRMHVCSVCVCSSSIKRYVSWNYGPGYE